MDLPNVDLRHGTISRIDVRREGRRRAVLDAALELFDQEGYRGVSMRVLSERVGLTAGALYRYFPSKEAVFDALAEEGFQHLIELVDQIEGGSPLERLFRQGMAYLEFAAEEPRRYRVMFLTPETTPSARKEQRTDVGKRSFGTVVQRIEEAKAEGTVPPDVDPMIAAHACWAAWHGAATIEAMGMLSMLPPECRVALRERVIRMSVEGVRS